MKHPTPRSGRRCALLIALFAIAQSLASCGGGGGGGGLGDGGSGTPPPPAIEVLAGHMGGPGNIDGTGTAARFATPASSTVDAAGNLYVTDGYNHVIRKITPAGVVTTIAGIAGLAGADDGPASTATFFFPGGLAFDRSGNLYIADDGNFTLRRLSPSGRVTTVAGSPGQSGNVDGTGSAARFGDCHQLFGCPPPDIVVDSQGIVFYGDGSNGLIRRITPDGVVTTFAGATRGADGHGDFNRPSSLAIDAADNLYVADQGNAVIRKITPAGVVTTLAGMHQQGGYKDGVGAAAQFSAPYGAGVLYVSDTGNNTIRRIAPDLTVTTFAGLAMQNDPVDGVGGNARFEFPLGLAVSATGDVFVADQDAATVRKITADGTTTTYAGIAQNNGYDDGPLSSARLFGPAGLAIAATGEMLVADSYAVRIRKIAAGQLTTLAGNASGWADGPRDQATFLAPYGVTTDAAGNAYVADYFGHTVRKIAPDGTVSTLAGLPAIPGASDGAGSAARFSYPMDVAADAAGNVYVADYGNHAIRKVSPAGVVTTLAGVLGVAGWRDGIGAAAGFYGPSGVTLDAGGNLYVADHINHTIRKIAPDGTVRTVVGTAGFWGFRGDRLPGVLSYPWRVAISGTTMYITTARGVVRIGNRL